jgi:hypothetical protein
LVTEIPVHSPRKRKDRPVDLVVSDVSGSLHITVSFLQDSVVIQ